MGALRDRREGLEVVRLTVIGIAVEQLVELVAGHQLDGIAIIPKGIERGGDVVGQLGRRLV